MPVAVPLMDKSPSLSKTSSPFLASVCPPVKFPVIVAFLRSVRSRQALSVTEILWSIAVRADGFKQPFSLITILPIPSIVVLEMVYF